MTLQPIKLKSQLQFQDPTLQSNTQTMKYASDLCNVSDLYTKNKHKQANS